MHRFSQLSILAILITVQYVLIHVIDVLPFHGPAGLWPKIVTDYNS